MARVLIGQNWFEGVSSHSWNESHFEALVVDRAPLLFPNWRCVPFSEKIYDESAVAKQPDLALIDPQYRAWWVIEIELAHHSLDGHVLPQVVVFRQGTYGLKHAQALHNEAPDLDLTRLSALMDGEPPGVMVVVDSLSTGWRERLRDVGVCLGIAEPFRDAHGTVVLRLNGEQPAAPSNVLTRCSRVSGMRRLWKVHAPAALPPGELRVEWAGTVTTWRRVQILGGVQLQALYGDVLAEWSAVDLVVREDQSLAFLPVQKRRQT